MRRSGEDAAPGPGVRIDDAGRERLIEALKRHVVAGRLNVEELERRVEEVYRARTQQEAMLVLGDLPPLAAAAAEPGRRRGAGHAEAAAPGAGWLATSERFRDPTSRRVMRVWVDPLTGDRHYVAEQD